MPEVQEAPPQANAAPVAPPVETLADRISKKVNEVNRKQAADAAAQEAPAAPPPPPAQEKSIAEPAKPTRRRREAKPSEDAVLPPEQVNEIPEVPAPDDQERQIEEGLQKPDKSQGIEHLRNAYKLEKQRAADLENQLKQAKEAPKAPEDYDDLKRKVGEYSTELERVALERHPEFRRKFGDQIGLLDIAAKKLVGNLTGTITPEDFTALLAAPASDQKTARISELIEGTSPLVASKVANLVSNYETLNEQKNAMLAQHSETLHQLDMEARASTQERLQREQLGFEQVVNDFSNTFEYLKPVEGNEQWNGLVNKIKGEARHLYFSEKDPAVLMQATVKAAMTDAYRNAYLLVNKQVQVLQEELSAIKKAAPSFGAEGGHSESSNEKWDEKKGFADNMAQRIAERSGMGGRI